MSKSIKLREDITSLLKSKHESVYHRKASSKAQFPYIVYTISDVGEFKELEVDYWDKSDTSERIEILADTIEKLLNEELINNEEHSCAIYYNNDRKFVNDEDKSIQRINETFEIRYFGKEQ